MIVCRSCPSGHEVCRRCARRLCSEHTPFGGDACADCELAYFESRDGLRSNVWFVVGLALPWMVIAALHEHLPSGSARAGGHRAITTGVPLLDILIMTAVISVFAGKAARRLRIWFHRRTFLEPSTFGRSAPRAG